jgi:hypothetical protein
VTSILSMSRPAGFLHRDQVVEAGDQTDAASACSSIRRAPARSSW